MARIFITGSSDGIGAAAARLLSEQGHMVTLHARSEARAKDAQKAVPKAEGILIGDISTISGSKDLAEKVIELATKGREVDAHCKQDLKSGKGVKETFAKWRGK